MRGSPVWYDDAAGPVVRPYTLTGGRTRPAAGAIDLIALVRTVSGVDAGDDLPPERAAILVLCRSPVAVAEIAARCDLPIGVTRVIISDLLATGRLEAVQQGRSGQAPDETVLRDVLRGLHAL
jgi:hypothetical protein